MPNITIVNQSGEATTINAETEITLMEAITNNGFDEMLAMCGGSCSCATCHVYIAEEFAGKVSEISEIESDLLDVSDHKTERSRLSCQIKVTDELEGITVEIAPED